MQIVVLAVIARAVVRIGQHIIEDRLLAGIAVVALIATLMAVPFWIILLTGGLAYAAAERSVVAVLVLLVPIVGVMIVQYFVGTTGAAGPIVTHAPATLAMLFIADC